MTARVPGILIFAIGLGSGLPAQTSPSPADVERPVSWRRLIPNAASDQKQIWSFPVRVAQGKYLLPTLGVLGVTAGLVALDPVDTGYFRRTTSFHKFNSVLSSTNTLYAIGLAPVSLYIAGVFRHDDYAKGTALLAGEAVVDAEILVTVMKFAGSRVRPRDLPATTKFGDTWFESKRNASGFPSGHAIAAFSVATVLSRRYSNHRWVPFVAYGLAGLVGFSRVTSSAHFPSDVFMGAALGYSISRFAVLRN